MKSALAIAAIVAAIFSLQPLVAAKSSSSSSQSVLDPLVIQEDTQKELVRQKHLKSSKRKGRSGSSKRISDSMRTNDSGFTIYSGHDNSTPVSERHKHSQLAEAFDYDSGSLKIYQKGHLHTKAPSVKTAKKSQKNAHSKLNNTSAVAVKNNNKNIFESGAEAAGKVATAPVRGIRALFKPRQSN